MGSPSDQAYRDIGVDPDRAREHKAKLIEDGANFSERVEQLRVQWSTHHGVNCAGPVPFESCGDCYGAFQRACDEVNPNDRR